MARILGIDYGGKRTGIAATDELQIIVSAVETVETQLLQRFLKQYFSVEDVEEVVIGKPVHKDGTPTYLWKEIEEFAKKLPKLNPKREMKITFADEFGTSVHAKQIIFDTVKKQKRRDKSLVDKVSAVLILQQYLGHI